MLPTIPVFDLVWKALGFLVLVLICFGIVWKAVKRHLCKLLAKTIREVGTKILKVQVQVHDLDIILGATGNLGLTWGTDDDDKSFARPQLVVTVAARMGNLTLGNPKGFKSSCLLHVEHVSVEIDIMGMLVSRFKRIDIHKVVLQTALVVWEKQLTTSNLDSLLSSLKKTADEEPVKPVKEVPVAKDEPTDLLSRCQRCCKREKKEPAQQITVHRVLITGVELELATTLGANIGVPGTVLAVGDIKYRHFSDEIGSVTRPDKIVIFLLETILRSALKNVTNLGKGVGNVVVGAAGATQRLAASAASGVGGLAGTAASNVTNFAGSAGQRVGRARDSALGTVKQGASSAFQHVNRAGDVVGGAIKSGTEGVANVGNQARQRVTLGPSNDESSKKRSCCF